MLAQWKGQFYYASVKFERSVFYDDKITVESGGFGQSNKAAVSSKTKRGLLYRKQSNSLESFT